MEPSYRIDLEHEPADVTLPWTAKIIRQADGEHVKSVWGTTRTEAFEAAQRWVRAKAVTPERTTSLYVNEDGEIHEASPAEVAAAIVNDANRSTLREVSNGTCSICGGTGKAHGLHAACSMCEGTGKRIA